MIPRPSKKSSIGSARGRHSLIPTSSRKNSIRTPQTQQQRFSNGRSTLSTVKGNVRGSYISQSETRMKDTRPLNDKDYMKKSILNLMSVLRELNFPDLLNSKMLNPPTNKTYHTIFQFLVAVVLGEYRLLGKPEEAMIQTLKTLGYPYSISKSTLANVGTMSAWPQSLGVLTWILTLIEYKDAVANEVAERVQLDPRKNWRRDFLTSAYMAFMQGDDGPYDDLLKSANDVLEQLDRDSHRTFKSLKLANQSLLEEYEKKNKEKKENEGLEDEITSMKSNIDQYTTYFQQIDNYLNIKTANTTEALNSIEERKLEIVKIKETIANLKSQISQQEINPQDLEHLTFKKNQTKQSIETFLSKTKLLKEKCWNVEINCSKSIQKMDDLVGQLNHKTKVVHSMLQEHILPVGAPERPSDVAMQLRIGHEGMESNAQQLISNMMPYVGLLNKKLLTRVGEITTENQNMNKKLLQDEEHLQDCESEKEKLQQEFDKLEAELQAEKQEANSQEQKFKTDMEKNEEILSTLRKVESQSVEEIKEMVLAAQNDLDATNQDCDKQEGEYLNCVVAMAKNLKSFKDKTDKLVKDVQDNREELIEKANAILKKRKQDLENIVLKCKKGEEFLNSLQGQEDSQVHGQKQE